MTGERNSLPYWLTKTLPLLSLNTKTAQHASGFNISKLCLNNKIAQLRSLILQRRNVRDCWMTSSPLFIAFVPDSMVNDAENAKQNESRLNSCRITTDYAT